MHTCKSSTLLKLIFPIFSSNWKNVSIIWPIYKTFHLCLSPPPHLSRSLSFHLYLLWPQFDRNRNTLLLAQHIRLLITWIIKIHRFSNSISHRIPTLVVSTLCRQLPSWLNIWKLYWSLLFRQLKHCWPKVIKYS